VHVVQHENMVGNDITPDGLYHSEFSSSVEAMVNKLSADLLMLCPPDG
jgi:hypothetical protein